MSSDDAFDEVQDMILQDAAKVFSHRLIEMYETEITASTQFLCSKILRLPFGVEQSI